MVACILYLLYLHSLQNYTTVTTAAEQTKESWRSSFGDCGLSGSAARNFKTFRIKLNHFPFDILFGPELSSRLLQANSSGGAGGAAPAVAGLSVIVSYTPVMQPTFAAIY